MKVLVGVDGSDHSIEALKWYLGTRRPDDELLLLHTTEFSVTRDYTYKVGIALPKPQWDAMVHQADEEFKAIKQKLHPFVHDIEHKYLRREGDPGHSICDTVKEEGAGMVVVGTRGQGKVRRTIMGSVSDYVLHHAHVPVAVYRN